jgi:hypothetical protein
MNVIPRRLAGTVATTLDGVLTTTTALRLLSPYIPSDLLGNFTIASEKIDSTVKNGFDL